MIYRNKKSVSALIATILLIVVAVALIAIILTWGKDFTNKSVAQVDTFKDASGVYFIQPVKLANGTLIFKNISTDQRDINIIGYKIIAEDPDTNTELQYLETPIILSQGSQTGIRITTPTDKTFTIQLYTSTGEYITVKNIVNVPSNVNTPETLGTVETPTSDIPEGGYNDIQTITLSTETEGASIYYTTNGDTPTQDSTLYTDPIVIDGNTTLKAIAYKEGWTESSEFSARYVIMILLSNGSGTQEDPYQISTPEELNYVRYYLDKYFIQTANIDLNVSPYNDGNGFSPIGINGASFTGDYNGGYYFISNLYINRPNTDSVGLFGNVQGGNVSNVILLNSNVTGRDYVGSLVGYLQNSSWVINCGSMATVSSRYYGGGLVGYNSTYSHISNSFSTGTVTGGSGWYFGGLVGQSYYSFVSNCFSMSNVTGPTNVGGLVGGSSNSSITNSYSMGTVTGNTSVGGLVGLYSGTITSSYYDSNTSGQTDDDGRGTPKTTEEMMQQATFVDWNFTDIWYITEGENYPILSWTQGVVG